MALNQFLWRALFDNLAVVEDQQAVAKLLTDSAAAADFMSLIVSLAKSDTVTTADQIALDPQKSVTGDSVTSTDTTAKSALKSLTDSNTTSDSGYLYSQGYCDITYFAEDYVGTSRTF